MSESHSRPHPFSRFEAHPFEGPEGVRICSFCDEHRASILHHPTRIHAACLLHGIAPGSLQKRPRPPAAA
ncbi:MAG: hypothetical protein ABFS41_15240 [Myxococcota bacterium]